jgi:hypothetical protein
VRVFLSGVKSRTHLLYAASYVDELARTGSARVTVVDLGTGAFAGPALVGPADVRDVLSGPDVDVVTATGRDGWRAPAGEPVTYVAVGAPGLKPYARLRAANPTRRIHVVVTDEGLGTYGTWHTRLDALRRQGGRGPWPVVRTLAVSGGRRVLADERWALYRRAAGGWVVDPRVAERFRADAEPLSTSDRAVFLSQPWVELGLLRAEEYVSFVTAVGAAVTAAGLSFVVRPHPVEASGRFAGLPVETGSGPAELDPSVAASAVVLGGPSTALLNLAAVHGTRGVRVRLPASLSGVETGLSGDQAELLDTFLPAPVALDRLAESLAAAG